MDDVLWLRYAARRPSSHDGHDDLMTAVMAVGMSVLFGWIIKKLRSYDVKKEFVPNLERPS